jgi:hypothetical protein
MVIRLSMGKSNGTPSGLRAAAAKSYLIAAIAMKAIGKIIIAAGFVALDGALQSVYQYGALQSVYQYWA